MDCIDVMMDDEDQLDFFDLINNDEYKVSDLFLQAHRFSFIRPLALGMATFCSHQAENEFSKELFVVIMLLALKLEDGDVCLCLNQENMLEIIEQKNILNELYSQELLKDCTKRELIENTIKKVVSTILDHQEGYETLLSSKLEDTTPLFAYAFDNPKRARIYLRSYASYENFVASFIKANVDKFDADENSKSVQEIAMGLNVLFKQDDPNAINHQKLAAALAAINQFSVICGGPGTGKTTTVLKLLFLLLFVQKDKNSVIKLAAPTGKAAARMIESIVSQLKNDYFANTVLELFGKDQSLYEQKMSLIPTSATTVHSLLKIYPHQEKPYFNENNCLDCDILIIDEISMIPLSIFSKLLKSIGPHTKVVMLGDKDQLCSVEPGSVLSDICSILYQENPLSATKAKLLSKLTGYQEEQFLQKFNGGRTISDYVALLVQSHRFREDSKLGKLASIVNEASEVNQDKLKQSIYNLVERNENLQLLEDAHQECEIRLNLITSQEQNKKGLNAICKNVATACVDFFLAQDKFLGKLIAKDFVIDDLSNSEYFDLLSEYRVLCANKNGPLGVNSINDKVNEMIKRKLKQKSSLKAYADDDFFPGRVILVTKNDGYLGIENGDVGFVAYQSQSDLQAHKARVFLPSKDGTTLRVISPERISDYTDGYAMTIHKSQGSEYQNICMILGERSNLVLTKELVYTGLTRAKEQVDRNNPQHFYGGKVSVITGEDVFFDSILKKVHRESGLSLMLN